MLQSYEICGWDREFYAKKNSKIFDLFRILIIIRERGNTLRTSKGRCIDIE